MNYLNAFWVGGLICALCQVLIDKTKLTPARVLVSLVVLGVILQGLGWYQAVVDYAGAGATVPLLGFGYSLAKGVAKAVAESGLLGVFTGGVTWAQLFPILLTIITVFAIGAMSKKKVKGAVLWGMLGGAVAYYAIGLITVPDFYNTAVAPNLTSDFFGAFKEFGAQAFGKVFTEGFDFSAYIAEHGMSNFIVMFLTTMLAFCMVDMFDTLGTLYGACAAGNMLTEDGNVPNMDKAMLADAVATCCGAVCGTSTVTTFVESSAGVAEGGRTGLTAVTTAVMFLLSIFLWPIFIAIPSFATAPALVFVGLLMIGAVKNMTFDGDIADTLGGFLAIIMMPFTYSIANGIMFGILTWMFLKIFRGKVKDIHPVMWVVFALFVLRIVTLCF